MRARVCAPARNARVDHNFVINEERRCTVEVARGFDVPRVCRERILELRYG